MRNRHEITPSPDRPHHGQDRVVDMDDRRHRSMGDLRVTWSPRKALAFITAVSAMLWLIIIALVY
jgi:hypothetical protein